MPRPRSKPLPHDPNQTPSGNPERFDFPMTLARGLRWLNSFRLQPHRVMPFLELSHPSYHYEYEVHNFNPTNDMGPSLPIDSPMVSEFVVDGSMAWSTVLQSSGPTAPATISYRLN